MREETGAQRSQYFVQSYIGVTVYLQEALTLQTMEFSGTQSSQLFTELTHSGADKWPRADTMRLKHR